MCTDSIQRQSYHTEVLNLVLKKSGTQAVLLHAIPRQRSIIEIQGYRILLGLRFITHRTYHVFTTRVMVHKEDHFPYGSIKSRLSSFPEATGYIAEF